MKKSTMQNSLPGKHLRLLAKLFLVGVFLVSQLGAFAQQKTLTGTVVGADGVAIPGVTVFVKGTTTGTVTDIDGNYSLINVPENATLSFSFVGMKTQEIVVGNQTAINVTMAVDAIGLDEVIAIGYGTARKKDLTGSIVNVNAEEVMKYAPESVSEMLRSAVPGLQVGYSTDARNTPDFNIRGDNTIKAKSSDEASANRPLIVLDGVIFNGDMAEINVNDIESVDVLKDASAASIYGSRASNGVVVFTTKKGKLGKPTIRVNAKLGLVGRGKHLDVFAAGDEVMDWLSDLNDALRDRYGDPWSPNRSYDKTPDQYKSDWLAANSLDASATPEQITSRWLDNLGFENNEKENYLAGVSYNWNDFLYELPALRQDYNVSISGRTDRVSYYWSVGYKNNESLQLWETFKTVTSRVNLDFKVSDFLNVGLNANMAYQDEGRSSVGSGSIRTASPYDMPWENNPDDLNVIIKTRENLRAAGAGSNRSNPLLNPSWTERKFDRYRIFPTMYAKLNLPFGVTLTSRWTQRIDIRKRLEFEDPRNPRFNHGGFIRRRHNESYEWQLDNILNWNKEFGEHRIDFTGLVNAEKNQSWYTDAQTRLLQPTAALGYHNMGFGLQPQTGSTDEIVTRSALMGRVNYGYGNRYNLSASIRQDGYSRFGADNVYATFPSVSASWSLTNEAFMADRPDWLSFLKIRASWGVNGNSSGIGSYAAYARLSSGKYLNYDGGYVTVPRLYLSRMANPTLAWEKNDAFNLGIDYGFWDGRVRGAIDIYTSQTTELLLDKKLPVVTGFSQITTNVGSMENRGIDLSINASVVEKSDFSWNTSFNMSYNQNEIVSLTGELADVVDENGNVTMKEPDDFDNGWFIGENKDVIWNYEFNGVYQIGDEAEAAEYAFSPGDFRVVDQNNDGVLNSKDKTFLGLSKNPWYITWRNDLTWKNLDLGVVFLSKLGWYGGSGNPFNADQTYIKNHNWYKLPYWKPDNPINDAARINSIRISDAAPYYVSKDYLRCQNVTLGYTLPSDLMETIKFSSVRVAFNIENAFILTKWVEGDPESQREMPRVFSFSVDFSL
ncbi:MAG: SusC/RagA family TonB-linked outer membrane protein [Draconibacterium sp.]|nr:SusC/RagA family TonB-linked outer membrane protein [Draconibacterium sp.]